nr:MAG TPA: protein of unknown function (DUF4969) [Caudoviricetes sp.]
MKKVLLAAVFALAGVSFFSCSSSNDDEPFTMNERAITMQKGDKYTITHTGKASWSSEDNFVASVNDGEVTANHVGETAIYAMSGGSKSQCNVTVRGSYNYFREPLCKLNATPEDVMRYETRSLDTKKSDRTTLIYYPAMNENIDVVAYTFKNDKLESAFVAMTMHGNASQALQMMNNFMSERYIGGVASQGYVYINAKSVDAASKQVFVSNTISGYEGITASLYTPLK